MLDPPHITRWVTQNESFLVEFFYIYSASRPPSTPQSYLLLPHTGYYKFPNYYSTNDSKSIFLISYTLKFHTLQLCALNVFLRIFSSLLRASSTIFDSVAKIRVWPQPFSYFCLHSIQLFFACGIHIRWFIPLYYFQFIFFYFVRKITCAGLQPDAYVLYNNIAKSCLSYFSKPNTNTCIFINFLRASNNASETIFCIDFPIYVYTVNFIFCDYSLNVRFLSSLSVPKICGSSFLVTFQLLSRQYWNSCIEFTNI